MKIDSFDILKQCATRLDTVSYYSILKLVYNLRLKSTISFNVPSISTITRALIYDNWEEVNNISQISYNPKPKGYGRANSPGEQMFYGSIDVPNTLDPRVINVWELIHVLHNKGIDVRKGEYTFIIGTWKLNNDMPVILAGFTPNDITSSSLFNPLYKKYAQHNRLNQRDIEITKFFGDEFSKIKIVTENDYKITCAIKEILFDKNSHGVKALIYPSVRTDKLGYNIAITTSYVKRYLELKSVALVRMYGGENVIVDVERECFEIENGNFDLVNSPYIGKDCHR